MNTSLAGKKFYFDKVTLPPEDQTLFEAIGCVAVSELRPDTNYIVAPQLPGVGGKYLRAAAFGATAVPLADMHTLLSTTP
jgi:hypothetical protein